MKPARGSTLEEAVVLSRHEEAPKVLDWEFYLKEMSAGAWQATPYWPRTGFKSQRSGTDELTLVSQVMGDAVRTKMEVEQHLSLDGSAARRRK